MTSRHLALAFFGALLFAAPLSVRAQDGDDDDAAEEDPEPEVSSQPDAASVYDRVLAFQLTAGIDTPLGVVGGAVEFTPFRYLVIYAGGGVSRSGGRFAGGVRGQFPLGNAAIGIAAGVGGGPLEWHSNGRDGETQIRRYWDMGLFLHSGISFEHRFDMGLFIRAAFGVDAYLTPDQPSELTLPGGERMTCNDPDGSNACSPVANDLAKPIRGWAGVSVGYALEL